MSRRRECLTACRVNSLVGRIGRVAFGLVVLAAALIGLSSTTWNHIAARAQAPEVDMALILAVDVSYSVSYREFRLQMDGMAQAFRRADIHKAIASGPRGRIAVAVMQWSDETHQVMALDWRLISSPEDALAFADVLEGEPRRLAEGGTAIGAALRFAAAAVLAAPVVTNRRVIDLSGDGPNNRGPKPQNVRGEIAARGVTINGLSILNEWPTLNHYFRQKVVGGPYHFVVVANDYSAYHQAIHRKLLREITGPGLS